MMHYHYHPKYSDNVTYFIKDDVSIDKKASSISYDNTNSSLESTNVQEAIDELYRNGSSGGSADIATKAEQDVDGNVITETYAKNSSILTTLPNCRASTGAGYMVGPAALNDFIDNFYNLFVPTYSSLSVSTTSGQSVKYKLITTSVDVIISLNGYAQFPGGGSNTQCNCNIMIDDAYVFASSSPSSSTTVNLPITGIYKVPAGKSLYLQFMRTSGQNKVITGLVSMSIIRIF